MRKNLGITLLELLYSMTFFFLLFFLGLFGLRNLLCKNQAAILQEEIITAIAYARTMAFLYEERLALTPLPKTKDWSEGMILFFDNKHHHYKAGDKLLQQWVWNNFAGVHLSWKGFQSNDYLLFVNDLKHAATSGHFLLSYGISKPIKLTINRFARVARSV